MLKSQSLWRFKFARAWRKCDGGQRLHNREAVLSERNVGLVIPHFLSPQGQFSSTEIFENDDHMLGSINQI